jgi:hypothetical protein
MKSLDNKFGSEISGVLLDGLQSLIKALGGKS